MKLDMDAIDSKLSMVFVSLVVIGLAAAVAGAGTMALFSDTEQSTDNTLQAGTLDLAIDGQNGEATTHFDVSNVAPGDSGNSAVNISNEGSLDGSVDVNLGAASNEENGMNEPEQAADSDSDGELGDNANVSVYIDANQDGEFNTSDGDVWVTDGTINDVTGEDYDVNATLASGDEVDLVIDWEVPASAGNEVQSDSVAFDVTVELNQEDSQ